MESYKSEYNIKEIIKRGYENRKHRGKQISHKYYIITFIDGTELDMFIPHYFEQVGFKRRMIKLLEEDKLMKRSKKINKIINGK